MKISLIYITARKEPHLEWLLEDLARQARSDDEIELIIIDALGRTPLKIGYRPISMVKSLIVSKPKPTMWQGEHRLTEHDFFANANARNTGIVLAMTDYLVFLDDRCHLDPGWLKSVRRGETRRKAVRCGPVDKRDDQGGWIDHRRKDAPEGKKRCDPSWTYGANIALPLAWALEVNGFEEGCDPIGLEDCTFGWMLNNIGRRIDFKIEMSVQQDRYASGSHLHPLDFPRLRLDSYHHLLVKRFSKRRRTEFTPDLTHLRAEIVKGRPFPLIDPTIDPKTWFDGSRIRGMKLSPEERTSRAVSRW